MRECLWEQIGEILRLCEDTDGVIVADREGIIRYTVFELEDYWKPREGDGRHILDLYPELDEDSSTILRALRTGKATYNVLQDIVNCRGERVLLESTTIPLSVNGNVECAVDISRYHIIDQRVIRGGKGNGLCTLDRIITQDSAMLALKQRVLGAAQLDFPVFIYGETGTGKELVAEALHSEGTRRSKPFVSQNCAAIPANLLESLFFGTEKGSYTGALTRKGLLEEADGGTLFLDEINSMDIGLQAKLLKVLDEKKVRRLGGSRDIPFDVRIIAAANELPKVLIQTGRLRQDLYYRLGVICLMLPPLRDRPDDIPLLANHFLKHYNGRLTSRVTGISEHAVKLMSQYGWPGNIRELKNAIEGALVIARGEELTAADMEEILGGAMESGYLQNQSSGAPPLEEGFFLVRALERYEREILAQAMRQAKSISQAARLLGLSRQNLKYKLQKYDL